MSVRSLRLLEDAVRATTPLTPFSLAFLKAEWDAVIEPSGITTWEEYRQAPRSNRGTPLGARQRLAVWRVFEHALDLMQQRRALTWDRVCIEAAGLVRDTPIFNHVIADEYQDLGPAEIRFLRALVPPGCDDLFLCGDSGQRIYKPPCSWLSLGVDIRGRSTNLKVNYRTTEQIRCFADRIVQSRIDAGAGETEHRGSVSLLSGPEPEVRSVGSITEEFETVAAWITALLETGISPSEVAIFARTEPLIRARVEAAVKRAGAPFRALKDDEGIGSDGIAVGTMHRAKGLEFRAVAVMGCDSDALPLHSVLSSLADAADRDEFVEQERQLLYVACTRARERLLVTATGTVTDLLPPVGVQRNYG